MDKTIRWNVSPEEQQEETYEYWQNVSVAERLQATYELSVLAYNLKKAVEDGEGSSRHSARTERSEG